MNYQIKYVLNYILYLRRISLSVDITNTSTDYICYAYIKNYSYYIVQTWMYLIIVSISVHDCESINSWSIGVHSIDQQLVSVIDWERIESVDCVFCNKNPKHAKLSPKTCMGKKVYCLILLTQTYTDAIIYGKNNPVPKYYFGGLPLLTDHITKGYSHSQRISNGYLHHQRISNGYSHSQRISNRYSHHQRISQTNSYFKRLSKRYSNFKRIWKRYSHFKRIWKRYSHIPKTYSHYRRLLTF